MAAPEDMPAAAMTPMFAPDRAVLRDVVAEREDCCATLMRISFANAGPTRRAMLNAENQQLLTK